MCLLRSATFDIHAKSHCYTSHIDKLSVLRAKMRNVQSADPTKHTHMVFGIDLRIENKLQSQNLNSLVFDTNLFWWNMNISNRSDSKSIELVWVQPQRVIMNWIHMINLCFVYKPANEATMYISKIRSTNLTDCFAFFFQNYFVITKLMIGYISNR